MPDPTTLVLGEADASGLSSLSALSMGAASRRGALLAALFDGARAAALAGDLDAARIAHEAVGKLLGAAVRPWST